MGYAHVLWIYEDAVRHSDNESEDRLAMEVGRAVLAACRERRGGTTPRPFSVFGFSNAVNWVDRVDAGERTVYAWSGNRLAPMEHLDAAEREALTASLGDDPASAPEDDTAVPRDGSHDVNPGDKVMIRYNPHREDASHIVGTVERVEHGTGFGGCDLVYVRYVEPWSGEEEMMPFAPGNLVFGGAPRLVEIAERLERQGAMLREMVHTG